MGAAPATSTTVSAATTTVTSAPATSTTVTTAPATSTTRVTTAATTSTVASVGAGDDDYGYDDGPAATTVPATTVPATTAPATTAPATTVPATTAPVTTVGGGGATVTVGAENFAFSPATVTVKAGDTVQWVLRDGSHTTTSGTAAAADGRWNEAITADAPVSIPFAEPGEYPFFCRFHPDAMRGTIVVEA